MSYQKCPCCNGTGKEYNSNFNETASICTVCKGHKIISEITGLPPGEIKKESKTNFEDIYKEVNKDFTKHYTIRNTLLNQNDYE